MCAKHLEELCGLRIAQSTIRGAGLGLFTTVARKKDRFIDYYLGAVYTQAREGDYVLTNDKIWIDAADPTSCAARFANAPVTTRNSDPHAVWSVKQAHNAEFQEVGDTMIVLVTSASMLAGAEVLASYGTEYFESDEVVPTLMDLLEKDFESLKLSSPNGKNTRR
jgi:hypothetical protein